MPDICPSPAPDLNIKVKLLHEACLWCGGEHRLASYLNVSVENIQLWLEGRSAVPDAIFLTCLDLLRPASAAY